MFGLHYHMMNGLVAFYKRSHFVGNESNALDQLEVVSRVFVLGRG